MFVLLILLIVAHTRIVAGSLLSDRDKEVDDDVESPHKQILYGARAMDVSVRSFSFIEAKIESLKTNKNCQKLHFWYQNKSSVFLVLGYF